jgi:DNA invertase Pin-like site-specific DNA recombinase
MERDQIAERTRMALAHKTRQGARLGAAPTGYRKVRGRDGKQTALVADPTGQALLLRVRGLQSQGLTLRAIAQQLTAEGATTPKGSSMWNSGTLSKMLRRSAFVIAAPTTAISK